MTNKQKAEEIRLDYTKGGYREYIYGADLEDAIKEMAEWKEQQMIEKACELYRSELKQFERLLIAYDKNAFTNLIDFEGTINDFKRGLEIEMLDNED